MPWTDPVHTAITEAKLCFARQRDDELPPWGIVPIAKRPGSVLRKTTPFVAMSVVSSGWAARSNSSMCDWPSAPVYKRVMLMSYPFYASVVCW